MHIQVSAKHHVLIHSLGGNCSDLGFFELDKAIALGSSGGFRASDARFCDFSELSKELFELVLVEAFGQMTAIDDSILFAVSDLQFVEAFGHLTLFAIRGFLGLSRYRFYFLHHLI